MIRRKQLAWSLALCKSLSFRVEDHSVLIDHMTLGTTITS
jgi:hypothetical protein